MKKFTTTVEKPRLVIEYDNDSDSPREWSNLGYFYTKDSRHHSPDGENSDIYRIMIETGDIASSVENHIELMKKKIKEETNEKVLAIYPVTKYEHSGISYSLGNSKGFDYSNNGFYFVTKEKADELGTKRKSFEAVIKDELDTYTKWANGEIYRFTLYDEQGEMQDSCCGFYDIEHIRDYLPEDWKDEKLEEYLKY